MKRKILIIGYNYYPEPTGIGKYSGEMVRWLATKGYDCTVITAYPYYPYWKVQEPYHKNRLWYKTESEQFESGGKITVHRCPMYVPSKPSGLKRMILDFTFLLSAFFKILQLVPGKKFDYVITIVPSFLFGLLGVFYKKIRSAKLMYHIHDMQIEAARDLKMITSEAVLNTLFKIEQYIFNQSDIITSVGEGMVLKIQKKTSKPVTLFPNWTDMNLFYPIADKASLKREFGFEVTDRLFLYSGAIGEKQGLELILHAANEFKQIDSIKFIICGSGPYKQKLQELAEKLALKNVFFFPLQPFEKFNSFLNMVDVHLIIQKANAGDLVMPSKLTTVLAVGGLALITSNKGSGMHSLVEGYNMGILVEAENQQALNEGIRESLTRDTTQLSLNARRYAEQFLAFEQIMRSFESLMVKDKNPNPATLTYSQPVTSTY